VKAVSFDVTVPGYVLGKTLGKITEAAVFGPLSGLRYGDVPEPEPPGDEWVGLEVLKAGICGSDIGNLTLKSSPAMEPFGSFPAVLGHEILARVVDVGSAVRRVEPGQRVAVEPAVSCTVRGYPGAEQCPSCQDGLPATCTRAGEEGRTVIDGAPIRRGMTIGYHASLPGGWGERMIAHESQLFPVADEMPDHAAVLIEPLAVGMHAALRSRPFPAGPILVIGSGPIALGLVWALRAAGFDGELIAQMKRPHEQELARAFGASETVTPGVEARDALVDTGARAYMPIIGDEVYAAGGFPLIFDCVGSAQSIKQGLRYASVRGRIVLLGCAAEISKLDLTFVWANELEIKGYQCYGDETWRGRIEHTFQITHDMILETGAPVEDMVIHVYPLNQYRNALSAAANHRKSGAVKVLLDPKAE
jgi:threonine dehydrogenase-like Zn-dependent dehydrogenase